MPDADLLVKLREWTDGDDTGGWPPPPKWVEYRVEGAMRADVLRKLSRPADDPCEVRLLQGVTEGGYSEYTVEFDYDFELWVHEDRQQQRVFDNASDAAQGLAAMLRWLDDA